MISEFGSPAPTSTRVDKENVSSNIKPVESAGKPGRFANGIRINSKVVFNFGGQNKIVFRSEKDSDDEYSVGTRTPFTPMSAKGKTPTKDSFFSPYLDFFNKSGKMTLSASPDSDDEMSVAPTPVMSPQKSPTRIMMDTAVNDLGVIPEEVAPEVVSLQQKYQADLDRLSDTGMIVHKVCGNNLSNQHKRALFLDPSQTFLYWAEKTAIGACEKKKGKLVRGLTRSKSWFKKNQVKEVSHKTDRAVLIENIASVHVGSGEFSTMVQIYTSKGRELKALILNIKNDEDRQSFLNAMQALKQSA